MKVYVDPVSDFQYAAFYLQGILDNFGSASLHFSSKYFKNFKQNHYCMSICFINDGGQMTKVVIDFGDSPSISNTHYNWSDVYAKLNMNVDMLEDFPKVFVIGPSAMPVRTFGKWETIQLAIFNLLKSYGRLREPRKFLSDYKLQSKKLSFSEFIAADATRTDYIHFAATLWKDDKSTNKFRANFIRAASHTDGVTFEGGFAPRSDNKMFQEYADCMGAPFEPYEVYTRKIRQSMVVFNTPAVKSCHGFKLPEFLSWGKAIISTPSIRCLEFPLIDGEHLLITDGTQEDIATKIQLLRDNPELRMKLEKNARRYFEENIHPAGLIRRILDRARQAS